MSQPVTPAAFKAVMGGFASGVTVVTTLAADGNPVGLTVSAFSALSLDPPLCLVCIDKGTGSHAAFRTARGFAVNVLSDAQEAVSNAFASRREDRFSTVTWEPGPVSGSPVFPEALATMDCELHEVVPGGDHDIFIGRLGSAVRRDGQPLLYWGGAYGDLSSRPKSW